MAVKDILKVNRKTFFNPSAWMNYDYLKYQTGTLWDIIKAIITPAAPDREETFEQAIERIGITEEDVKSIADNYRAYAFGFFLFGLMALIYAFYLLFIHVRFTGWMLGIATSALFFVQAFRYDFWSFQMRRRKLGATFAEWKQSIWGGNKDKSE